MRDFYLIYFRVDPTPSGALGVMPHYHFTKRANNLQFSEWIQIIKIIKVTEGKNKIKICKRYVCFRGTWNWNDTIRNSRVHTGVNQKIYNKRFYFYLLLSYRINILRSDRISKKTLPLNPSTREQNLKLVWW